MCYTAKQLKYRDFKIAIRYSGLTDDDRIALQKKWLEYDLLHPEDRIDAYWIDGFAHPRLLTLIDDGGLQATRFRWGLVPHWVKDEQQARQIENKTLNARGETIFEKPSFRDAAQNKRCLIVVDGFFEYHHRKGKTYPYFIQHVQEEFLVFGGLWSEWADRETGELIQTASIVTTAANDMMAVIHNNPKASDGPRMPLILEPGQYETWLRSTEREEVQSLIQPYQDGRLRAHTVGKLKGKDAVGNGPEAIEEVVYPELAQGSLF